MVELFIGILGLLRLCKGDDVLVVDRRNIEVWLLGTGHFLPSSKC